MKFNSQICTTRAQSERLLALGLKKETADMTLQTALNVCYTIPFQEAVEYFENRHLPPHPTILPAWSLHRLIEILDIWYLELNFNEFNNAYDQVISYLEERVKGGFINKEYLEE
jgi:hypothetical protein